MNDRDYRDEIVRLEELIDELAARIESCRKFILAGRTLVIGGRRFESQHRERSDA
jgi:cob(I)alamin adenosyltransferase